MLTRRLQAKHAVGIPYGLVPLSAPCSRREHGDDVSREGSRDRPRSGSGEGARQRRARVFAPAVVAALPAALLAPGAARAANECVGAISSTNPSRTCTATTCANGIICQNTAPGANTVATVVVPGGSTAWTVTSGAGTNFASHGITLDSAGARSAPVRLRGRDAGVLEGDAGGGVEHAAEGGGDGIRRPYRPGRRLRMGRWPLRAPGHGGATPRPTAATARMAAA